MKQISGIPLVNIERMQIYINTDKKELAQIKQETGADYLINGGLYDMAKWKANCHLKADGYIHSQDPYTYFGYGWDAGPDIAMQIIPSANKNYISCVELIRQGIPNANPTYTPAQGGTRGRTAIGIAGDKLCMYVSSDGSSDARTPESLRDELYALGWKSAVMLDSGGSSQCDFIGKKIVSSRWVHNLILVYLKKGGGDVKKTVCLDPGHGPDTVNGSPDGTYLEREFTWDMYTRIKPMLEKQGINVVGTRKENEKPDLTVRAKVSDNAKADLLVSLHTNATGGAGWNDANGLIVYTSASGDTAQRNVAARKLLDRFRESGVTIRGTGLAHDITLTVLAKPIAPAVLIEYGFHTNKTDVELLKLAAYRDILAVATAKGICDFLGVKYVDEVAPAAPWYAGAVKWAQEQGISDGTRPEDKATRAEVFEMFRRLKK